VAFTTGKSMATFPGMPRTVLPAVPPAAFLLLLAPLVQAGCNGEEAPLPPPAAEAGEVGTPPSAPGQHHERFLVFTTPAGDSAITVPWFFTTRTRPGGADRRIRAWLVRDGSWEAFLDEGWDTPPTRSPWRILPRGPVKLVVGDGEALDRIIFLEGPRLMELAFHRVLAEWTGGAGETVRLQEGSMVLGEGEVPGVLLDMARFRNADAPPPGEWGFLLSGDSLLFVLEDPGTGGSPRLSRAWARQGFRTLQWPEVVVAWAEERPFEPARRDVPLEWTLASLDGEVSGTLAARTSHLRSGEGEGPILPVDGLFEVAGILELGGGTYAVRGLLRHVQY